MQLGVSGDADVLQDIGGTDLQRREDADEHLNRPAIKHMASPFATQWCCSIAARTFGASSRSWYVSCAAAFNALSARMGAAHGHDALGEAVGRGVELGRDSAIGEPAERTLTERAETAAVAWQQRGGQRSEAQVRGRGEKNWRFPGLDLSFCQA